VVAVLLVLMLAVGVCAIAAPSGSAAASVTFSMADLKAMPASAGHYTFLKQLEPYTYYEGDYKGVALSTLLDQALRVDAGASQLVFKAGDGYSVTLSLDEARATYPNGLKCIVAYEKDNGKALAGEEGPLRLIVPQTHPGKRDQGGDANTPKCERMLASMEVAPVPSGVQVPSPSSVPSGSLAVYGSVSRPPAPAPAPTPVPQPAQSSAAASNQTQAAAPQTSASTSWNHEAIAALFGGARGLATVISGASISMLLPPGGAVALRRAFFNLGSGR
jgi:hypothetical protein